jgi:epoxyqueuosine reductase
MDIKQRIISIAQDMGFHRVVIGSLEPMEIERQDYENWLAKGFAAGMEYLKRNPHFRTSPALLYPGSKSAILLSVSYYTEPQPQPAQYYGRVARYAVGLDYHIVIAERLKQLKAAIEEEIGRPLLGKAFTDDVALYEQGYAKRHGLGFAGKHSLIIGPALSGSYFFVAELFTDLELAADQPYRGTCGKCFRCGTACPTDAINDSGEVDANLCISYLTIENKGGIPLQLRSRIGQWVFGCDICQEVCPYNQRALPAPWPEFQPESGVGHYLDPLSLLTIGSEAEFRSRFAQTALLRPKRRGLLRNGLVVLGNVLAAAKKNSIDGRSIASEDWVEKVVHCLGGFAQTEKDLMLREHAAWALSQSGEPGRSLLRRMLGDEQDGETHEQIRAHLGRL